ncbi:hypothetical protein EBR96_08440 [bacterium]|nr:hypothetical protein [bacterium]
MQRTGSGPSIFPIRAVASSRPERVIVDAGVIISSRFITTDSQGYGVYPGIYAPFRPYCPTAIVSIGALPPATQADENPAAPITDENPTAKSPRYAS